MAVAVVNDDLLDDEIVQNPSPCSAAPAQARACLGELCGERIDNPRIDPLG